MRKILIVLMVLTMFLGAQIFRHSESGIKQPKIEYTQGGILLRFDFVQTERIEMEGNKSLMWEYQEFWIPLNMTITDIQKLIGEKGYKLTGGDIKTLTAGRAIEMLILSGADSTEIVDISEENEFNLVWGLILVPVAGGVEAIRRWRAKRKAAKVEK